MLTNVIQWFKVEPSKKIILLTLGIGAASVLIALFLAVVVLCMTSQPLESPPLILSLLLFMGQTSQVLFQIGPVLLVIGAVLWLGKKIRLYNRRKPKESMDEKGI